MTLPNHSDLFNDWHSAPSQPQTPPSHIRRESSSESILSSERVQFDTRSGLSRNATSVESHTVSRTSASTLSEAMGTASPSQRPTVPSELSAKPSPSRASTNQSNQIRAIQLPWDMGISGASGLNAPAVDSHALLSPVGAQISLLPFESLDASSGFRSPYSPPTSLIDISDPRAAIDMSSSYPDSVDRYYQHRPASSAAVSHSSPMLLAQSYSHPHSSPHALGSFSAPPPLPPQHTGVQPMHSTPSPPSVFASPMDEVERLRRIVRDYQTQNRELHSRCEQLQSEATASRFAQTSALASPAETMSSQFPMPLNGLPIQAPLPPHMEASWRRRTDARIRKFCSPNRAGNALCAWHDTRRERRAYPPRMAPPAVLNCGCTVAQALFEESLSRHGVGSYLPGDTVRMDPALRNPLLRVLEERYGYRDGDFERNPETGGWLEGEGHEYWEAELHRNTGGRHR